MGVYVPLLAAVFLLTVSCGQPSPTTAPTATTEPPPSTAPAAGDPAEQPVLPPPYTVVTTTLLTDPSGFPGAPAVSEEGIIFVAGLSGNLIALTETGQVLWETQLPAKTAGTPLVLDERLFVLDRLGLNAFTTGGEPLWRFEHAAGTAIAGPAAGPDGTLYYTVQTASRGHIQAVTAGGEPLWLSPVATHSYFRAPQATPNGQLVLFRGEVFSTIDGAPVDLGLDFEPEALSIGADRQLYLLFESALVRWTYADGRAVLADERVVAPHELGPPFLAGVLENGEVWFVYPAAIAWFSPSGRMLHIAHVEEGFFTHFIDITGDGVHIVCGRSRADVRENGLPNCAGFSLEFGLALWNRIIGHAEAKFTGGSALPDGGAVVSLEDGGLYRIEFRTKP
ncbi:MAG TPA: PQQ-binding-like beta-propeller repeat protein [Anaerolineales bacterium]|nr:PQQ-binding-like beta-propeller repeat protein [Anaerolineales bacterium]